MSETQKTMLILGLGGGMTMVIGALILFFQNQTITGIQFHTDQGISEEVLSWHGLVFLGLLCIGMGVSILFDKENEVCED